MLPSDSRILPAILKKLGLKEIELTNKEINEAPSYHTQETDKGCKITLH